MTTALLGWILLGGCKKDGAGGSQSVDRPTDRPPVTWWLTNGNRSALFARQQASLPWSDTHPGEPSITLDSTQIFQSVEGFGFALTGGSADVLAAMPAPDRHQLLQELFGTDSASIGISYLRLSIGASDLSDSVFSYDDVTTGSTDTALDHFSLGPDTVHLIPVLREILSIQPSIRILAAPWSPPLWMKSNGDSIGGSLLPQYYSTYAKYLVKYIQAMQSNHIAIDAITVQNEPLYGGNNPSMLMSATEQDSFIVRHLGPALAAAGITTKILLYDHNCDRPDYPLSILGDAAARAIVTGSAFHLYAGDVSALGTVHDAYPSKDVYFTEIYTSSQGNFGDDLKWHMRSVVIGSMRNWSKTAIEWNLANDPQFGPHTQGGCTTCKGAVTIGSGVTRNVGYYIIAHASRFVRPGSVRIASNVPGDLQNVAFMTPAHQKVLIVENDGALTLHFNIIYQGHAAYASLDPGSVGTYVWQ